MKKIGPLSIVQFLGDKMSKILVCGDLHAKYNILEMVKEKAKDFDKVIFLGDYVDDWGKVPEASYNLLNSLIEWEKAEPKKVILLWGNHDLSEYYGGAFICSGYQPLVHSCVKDLYEDNLDLFQLTYYYKNYLFSHAGLTRGWQKPLV